VQSREPDDLGLLYIDPVSVLLVSSLEVSDPACEALLRLWCEPGPSWWQLSVEEGVTQHIKVSAHSDLTIKCSLEVLDRRTHFDDQDVESLQLLEQDDLCGRWHVEALPDVVLVVEVWQCLVEDSVSDLQDDIVFVDATFSASS